LVAKDNRHILPAKMCVSRDLTREMKNKGLYQIPFARSFAAKDCTESISALVIGYRSYCKPLEKFV